MDNNLSNDQSKKSTCESVSLDDQINSAESQKVDDPNGKITKPVRQKMISKEDESRL